MDAVGDSFDEELLEEGSNGSGGGADEPIIDGEVNSAIGGGVVRVREACGGKVAKDVGVVGLPTAVVAFADEDGGDGVHCS